MLFYPNHEMQGQTLQSRAKLNMISLRKEVEGRGERHASCQIQIPEKIYIYISETSVICINIEVACYESDLNQRDGRREGRRLYCLDFCLPLLACLSSVQTSRWRINSSLDTVL